MGTEIRSGLSPEEAQEAQEAQEAENLHFLLPIAR
jgi:hypothetical protein